jgi:hypothetical protein
MKDSTIFTQLNLHRIGEEFADTKRVIRIRKLKDRGNTITKRKKDKQRSAKHHIKNYTSSNTNPIKTGGELSSMCKKYLLHTSM